MKFPRETKINMASQNGVTRLEPHHYKKTTHLKMNPVPVVRNQNRSTFTFIDPEIFFPKCWLPSHIVGIYPSSVVDKLMQIGVSTTSLWTRTNRFPCATKNIGIEWSLPCFCGKKMKGWLNKPAISLRYSSSFSFLISHQHSSRRKGHVRWFKKKQ